jgi:hypothetical protein
VPYAVLDPDGNLVDVVPDVDTALDVGSQVADDILIEESPEPAGAVQGSFLGDFGARGPAMVTVADAVRKSGLAAQAPIRLDLDMDLEEAWERLYPYFPKTRFYKTYRGQTVNRELPINTYSDPEKMSRRLLGQNYKTAKKDLNHEDSTNVQGLSILPAFNMMKAGFKGVDACVGASPGCRSACLVYAGRNEIDPYNKIVKRARHEALLREPAAFVRMLAENIDRHARRRTAVPLVRLNVFSDLPWEKLCPDLFQAFPDLQYYDYTKVPGRDPVRDRTPNYHLTFSYSGVNHAAVAAELERGRNIAVVFIPLERIPADQRARGEGLPRTLDTTAFFKSSLGNVPIIDGDVSDVRPYDARQTRKTAIVGLRWKIPKQRDEGANIPTGRAAQMLVSARKTGFAVPVENRNGVLIAAVGARHEPMDDPDNQDHDDDVADELVQIQPRPRRR